MNMASTTDEEKQECEKCQEEEQYGKEKRGQAELKHQRKIKNKTELTKEALWENISEAHNRHQLEQNLKAHDHDQQHSQILHPLVEDQAHHTLLQNMEELPQEDIDQDGKHNLSDVKHFKDELSHTNAESVSNSYSEACSRHMTSFISKQCTSTINDSAGDAIGNILGMADTQSFLDNQEYIYNMNKAMQHPCESLSQSEKKDLECYIEEISDVNHPATALDIHVLTQSEVLDGKGIKLVTVDKHGKKLSEDHFPGKDDSAGDIVLQLKKEPKSPTQIGGFFSKITKWTHGEQSPYSGHFEILRPDGNVIPVNSEDQNCLYHAVAQATCRNPGDLGNEAKILRKEVKNSLQQNLPRYAEVLKLQKGYEETGKSPGRYYICGGGKQSQAQKEALFEEACNDKFTKDNPKIISDEEYDFIRKNFLGLVGKSSDVRDINSKNRLCKREADHIPPMQVFTNLWKKISNYADMMKGFPKEIIEKMECEEKIFQTIIKVQSEKEEIGKLFKENFECIWNEVETMINEKCTDKEIQKKFTKERCEQQNIARMISALRKKEENKKLLDEILALDEKIIENLNSNENINLKDIVIKIKTTEKIITQMRALEDMKSQKKGLYDLIHKNGNKGLCKNVLKWDHQKGLTYLNTDESKIISEKLQDILIAGDGEKLIKMSMMVANPVVSKCLKDLKKPNEAEAAAAAGDAATKWYHNVGDELLVKEYHKMNVINKQEEKRLLIWLRAEDLYKTNTPEYKELYNELKSTLQKKKEKEQQPVGVLN